MSKKNTKATPLVEQIAREARVFIRAMFYRNPENITPGKPFDEPTDEELDEIIQAAIVKGYNAGYIAACDAQMTKEEAMREARRIRSGKLAAQPQPPLVEQIADELLDELYEPLPCSKRRARPRILAAIEKATGPNVMREHQAEAWCHVVTALICDYGLEHTEPGKVALDQVLNFFRRKLPPVQPQRSDWREAADLNATNEPGSLVKMPASGAASGTPTSCSPERVAGSEQPTWACSKWGGYEHDWMECPECLEAYSKLNESGSEPLKEERGEPQEWTPEYVKKLRQKATDKRNNPLDGDAAIADSHNAAIAAERQKVAWCEPHEPTATDPITCCPCCEAVHEREKREQAEHSESKSRARMSERKSVHQWLNDIEIPSEENGKRICLLRRLRITLDRLLEIQNEVDGLKDANRGLYVESNERYQQLMQAQAAIEKTQRRLKSIWDECEMGYIIDDSDIRECGQCGGKGKEGREKHDSGCIQFLLELAQQAATVDLSSLHEHDAEVREPLVEALECIKNMTTTPARSFSGIYDIAKAALAQAK